MIRPFFLGRKSALPGVGATVDAPVRGELPSHHLVTHAAVLGMTGSGKTGLVAVLAEEALASRVPTLLIDIKGDLANLLLLFPQLGAADFLPWIDGDAASRAGKEPQVVADAQARAHREGLAGSGLGAADVAALRASIAPRVITPGASTGEPLHVLSSLERRSSLWEEDEEAAREAVSATISLVLRLIGRDGDPRSKEHVVLSTFAEARLAADEPSGVADLLRDVLTPPVPRIGALAYEDFLPPKEQKALAQDLNMLLASPKLSSWMRGASLDVGEWLTPVVAEVTPGRREARTPLVIVSVAHLDDEERSLVLGLLLEQILAYVRSLKGTSELRSMIVFDEVFGFLPPHPANPPTKRPLLALLKQARAFGVGLILATQNPMDVDYKALSNAGVWFVGRLQTDADRERVVEGLVGADGGAGGLDAPSISSIIKSLPKRAFFLRDVHASPQGALVETRYAMSFLRGPMTRRELAELARSVRGAAQPTAQQAQGSAPTPAPTIPVSSAEPAHPVADASSKAARVAPARAETDPPAVAASSGPPSLPDGWRTLHGYAPEGRVTYAPFLAASARIRGRDAKLQLVRERTVSFVAPLNVDGRVELAKASIVDPANLDHRARDGATYSTLTLLLDTKKGAKELERVVREHASAAYPVEVEVNRELGISRNEGEAPAAFAARVERAAAERAAAAEYEEGAKFGATIAKLQNKLAHANRDLGTSRAALESAPSGVGAAFLGIVVRGAATDARRARTRAETAVEKAASAVQKAEAALAAEITEQRVCVAKARDEALRAARGTTVERILPKRGDVELVWIGIAWSARPASG